LSVKRKQIRDGFGLAWVNDIGSGKSWRLRSGGDVDDDGVESFRRYCA
jgi:hypothetical protein